MAIAHDTSGSTFVNLQATCTLSLTIGAGANRGVVVMLDTFDNNGFVGANTVTWNTSESLTRLVQGKDANSQTEEIWFLPNPTSGTHNIVASGSWDTVVFSEVGLIAEAVTGIQQTTTADATNHNVTNGNSTGTATVTTVADLCWVFSICQATNTGVNNAGSTNQVSRGNPNGWHNGSSSSTGVTPAGSNSHTYSNSNGAESWTWAIASLAPFAAVGAAQTPGTYRNLMGVGQ